MPHPEDCQPLLSAEAIAARVAELGGAITEDYRGKELVIVGVLRGAFVFLADLARAIRLPLHVEFLSASSYGGGTESSGVVQLAGAGELGIRGRHVLLVEDIVDTGLTAHRLLEALRGQAPASLALCTLLHKPSRCRVPVEIAYRGFEIPDVFVVGYGLDHDGRLRNLPWIGHRTP